MIPQGIQWVAMNGKPQRHFVLRHSPKVLSLNVELACGMELDAKQLRAWEPPEDDPNKPERTISTCAKCRDWCVSPVRPR